MNIFNDRTETKIWKQGQLVCKGCMFKVEITHLKMGREGRDKSKEINLIYCCISYKWDSNNLVERWFKNVRSKILEDARLKNSSVQFSRSVVSDFLRPHESQHARPPCPSPTPGVHSDSRPSSQWCHPAISSSGASP